MSSKQFKESKIKFTVFFYLSILLSIFFLFQIRYTLNVSIKNWDLTQYTLLILVGCFLLICILRYHTFSLELKQEKEVLDLEMKQLTFKKSQLKDKIASMNPYDFGELVADLFRAKGYKRVFLTPHMNQHFYDLEMYLDDDKVLVSCLLGQNQSIGQAYLDRLYLKMKQNQVNHGIFVTLGTFNPECSSFIQTKPSEIINGDELIETFVLNPTI